MWSIRSAEFDDVVRVLRSRGVTGAEDFGCFVNDTRHLEGSTFDHRAALPVLLELLPTLNDAKAVSAAAGHVRQCRLGTDDFDVLRDTYLHWAQRNSSAGWALGDALAKATTAQRAPELIEIATNAELGTSRQQIVYSLWRFRRSLDVAGVLRTLAHDPDVRLVALSALGRVVEPAEMIPVLEDAVLETEHEDQRKVLERELRKVRKKLDSV